MPACLPLSLRLADLSEIRSANQGRSDTPRITETPKLKCKRVSERTGSIVHNLVNSVEKKIRTCAYLFDAAAKKEEEL
ncbi:hypothetical protein NDU88_003031 [Pleurodeles waltl]|uniref:Uncharacterized protein n=1 Tax=Pleurodeles waltl TaxID=8319 RepID=A0AAV7QB26_PLEWA|nr:hypothetical protein NDU88_003031 [Pleurodeles waltl]